MVQDDESISMSVHGETRSGFRPTGLRAVGGLTIAMGSAAGALALARSELWALAAVSAFVCAISIVLATVIALVARARGHADVTRWPEGAVPRAIHDARESEIACVRGRVLGASVEAIDLDGVRCVAVSTSKRGGVTTRAVQFVIEEPSGRRVLVDASELIVCGRASNASRSVGVPVGAEVEAVGVAHWTASRDGDATLRGGPALVLARGGNDPVRVRVCSGPIDSRVRVDSSAARSTMREPAEIDAAGVTESESSRARTID
jgi:hypothetical protein